MDTGIPNASYIFDTSTRPAVLVVAPPPIIRSNPVRLGDDWNVYKNEALLLPFFLCFSLVVAAGEWLGGCKSSSVSSSSVSKRTLLSCLRDVLMRSLLWL